LANVAAVVGFVPGMFGLQAGFRAPNEIAVLLPVNVNDMKDVLKHFSIGHPDLALGKVPGNAAVLIGVLGLVLGALGTIEAARHRGRRWWRVSRELLLIVVLTVVPFVLMIVYSLLRVDVLGAGNIIASWPAMALFIGALVTTPPRPLRVVAVALLLSAYAIGGVRMLSPTWQRGNVNGAVAYIERTGNDGDPVVSLPAFANPLSEVDAALADTPSYTYVPGNTLDRARSHDGDPHPVIRLNQTPLDETFRQLEGPRPNAAPIHHLLPTPEQDAQGAMSEARHGTIFLVTPYPVRADLLLKYFPSSPLSEFLKPLLSRYHIVREVQFPSFSSTTMGST
jgi:hypothetical protein